jgi:hypothetical protein
MSSADDWQRAYARQARADFETWEKLQERSDIPLCHKLQFLQMACEKLAKAHRVETGTDPDSVQRTHAVFAKAFPPIAKYHYARMGRSPARYDPQRGPMRQLAREIELLSPAVNDDERRHDNCEYPWELQNKQLRVPAEFSFPNLRLLTDPVGRNMLKIVHEAIGHLA